MTVKELIEQLQQLPADLRVVVRGYEGGVDDIDRLEQGYIQLNAHQEWYYGKHERVDDEFRTADHVPAVELIG
jgi:ribosome modulation factor